MGREEGMGGGWGMVEAMVAVAVGEGEVAREGSWVGEAAKEDYGAGEAASLQCQSIVSDNYTTCS